MPCQNSVVHFSCSTEVASKKVICRGLGLSVLVFVSILGSQSKEH